MTQSAMDTTGEKQQLDGVYSASRKTARIVHTITLDENNTGQNTKLISNAYNASSNSNFLGLLILGAGE